jgi:hypothetical protein
MPKKIPVRSDRDYALLEQRYLKLLRIATLPESEREQAIGSLLDECGREAKKAAARSEAVSALNGGGEEATPRLLEPTSQSQFPTRSPEELKRFMVTFLDLMLAEKQGKPN